MLDSSGQRSNVVIDVDSIPALCPNRFINDSCASEFIEYPDFQKDFVFPSSSCRYWSESLFIPKITLTFGIPTKFAHF